RQHQQYRDEELQAERRSGHRGHDGARDHVPFPFGGGARQDRRRKSRQGKGEEMMKLGTIALTLIAVLAFASAGISEEALPSQKTKEAVDKFNQTPSAIGQKFDDLKATLRDKLGKGAVQPVPSSGADPFGAPEKTERPDTPHYSPMGKRDPFQAPMKAAAKRRPRENLS